MPLPVWIALVVLVVVTTAAAFHLFLRVRQLWRTFKGVVRAAETTLQELTDSLDRLQRHAEAFGGGSPRLEASRARLGRSLSQAAVLQAAVRDARDSFGRLTAVYPRK